MFFYNLKADLLRAIADDPIAQSVWDFATAHTPALILGCLILAILVSITRNHRQPE